MVGLTRNASYEAAKRGDLSDDYAGAEDLQLLVEHVVVNELEVPTYIYHLGDYGPSGVDAGDKIGVVHRTAPAETPIRGAEGRRGE
jgi:hypothetical protein